MSADSSSRLALAAPAVVVWYIYEAYAAVSAARSDLRRRCLSTSISAVCVVCVMKRRRTLLSAVLPTTFTRRSHHPAEARARHVIFTAPLRFESGLGARRDLLCCFLGCSGKAVLMPFLMNGLFPGYYAWCGCCVHGMFPRLRRAHRHESDELYAVLNFAFERTKASGEHRGLHGQRLRVTMQFQVRGCL